MNEIEEILARKQVRPTAMRMLVYRFMADQGVALTLTDLENAFTTADRTTLYRTVKTFEDRKMVHQIDDGSGITKYALCEPDCNCELGEDLHLHFYCHQCQVTVCLTDHKVPLMKLPGGYAAENVNLVVKGLCDKCNT